MSQPVFISYSRRDRALVGPVVRLLRATASDWVFQDEDTLRPGEPWRSQLQAALNAAHLVLVFWCQHSSRSTEVVNEYQQAIALQKAVVPVQLDHTPLPVDLGAFEGVDLTGALSGAHGRRLFRWLSRAVLALLIVLAIGYSVDLLFMRSSAIAVWPTPEQKQAVRAALSEHLREARARARYCQKVWIGVSASSARGVPAQRESRPVVLG